MSTLRSLDNIFSAKNSTLLALRLALVQLQRVLDAISAMPATQKQPSKFSLALDLYAKAQGLDIRRKRSELNLRRRLAQRWIDTSATQPLLLVLYTEEAERIM